VDTTFSATLDPSGEHLEVLGEVDLASADQFAAAMDLLLARGTSRACVRMAGVTFIDSSGLAALLRGHRSAADRNITLVVVEPSEPVRALLRLTALDLALRIEDADTH